MSCGVINPHASLYMNKRAERGERYEPTFHEHIANTVSHGIAIVPSVLIARSLIYSAYRDLQYNIACIYGFFTTFLFVTSTLYHLCELLFRPRQQKLRYYLHVTDRIAIYFFIASSSMPWLSLRYSESVGTNMKWIVWVFALFGIAYQLMFHERYKRVETTIYILNASLPYVVIIFMGNREGLPLMIGGGLVYAIGVIFFKLDGVVPFAHAIWHCHVLIGASIHTYAVHNILLGPSKYNPYPDV